MDRKIKMLHVLYSTLTEQDSTLITLLCVVLEQYYLPATECYCFNSVAVLELSLHNIFGLS